MKKNYVITPIALGAILSLFFAVTELFAAPEESQTTVSFEFPTMPALNCSMSLEEADHIYQLLPNNIIAACEKEYPVVRKKCQKSFNFTYQGVGVHVLEDNGWSTTIEFIYRGNRMLVQDASWEDLDRMFNLSVK